MAGKQQSENNTSQNIIKLHKFMLVIEQFKVKNLSNKRNRQGGSKSEKVKISLHNYDAAKNNLFEEKQICLTKEIREGGRG